MLGSGAPLYGNYSKQEAALSETTMSYWVRFFRTGSPNFTTTETEIERSKGGRGEKVGWPAYDPVHQKYLTLGTKPKVRDHYHAHRLSVWTQLIPKLHRAGGGDVPRSHHLLEDFDDAASYDGVVREVPPPPPPMSPSPTPSLPHSTIDSNSGGGGPLTTSGGARAGKGAQDGGRGGVTTPGDPSQTEAMAMPQGGYSTALGVTIAVGCSLLILNVLIFAGVYYQRDKAGRASDKAKKRPFEPPRLGDELGRGSPPSQPASILAGSGTLKRPPPASPCTGGCEHLDYQSTPAVVTGCLAVAPPKVPPKPNSLLPSDHPEAQPLLPLSASARVLSPVNDEAHSQCAYHSRRRAWFKGGSGCGLARPQQEAVERANRKLATLSYSAAALSRIWKRAYLSCSIGEGGGSDAEKEERAASRVVGSGVGEKVAGERRTGTGLAETRWRYTLGREAANDVSARAAALFRQRVPNRCSALPDSITIGCLPSICI
ncbi:hypothetical protein MTO96_023874 [Rhipicephalus appendiculatus]